MNRYAMSPYAAPVGAAQQYSAPVGATRFHTKYDQYGREYTVQKVWDQSVPNLNLTPKDVSNFARMLKFINNANHRNVESALKRSILFSALQGDLNPNSQINNTIKKKLGVPKLDTDIWDKLCDLYNREYPGSIYAQNSDFGTPPAGAAAGAATGWLQTVVTRYKTHEYLNVDPVHVEEIVVYYLHKCHENNPEQLAAAGAAGFGVAPTYSPQLAARGNWDPNLKTRIPGVNPPVDITNINQADLNIFEQDLGIVDGRRRRRRSKRSKKSKKSDGKRSKRSKKSKKSKRSKSAKKLLKKLLKSMDGKKRRKHSKSGKKHRRSKKH